MQLPVDAITVFNIFSTALEILLGRGLTAMITFVEYLNQNNPLLAECDTLAGPNTVNRYRSSVDGAQD